MRSVTQSMGVPLYGYVVGPDGDCAWTPPDGEVFQFATDEIRDVGVHLLGRRLHERMLCWETADRHPSLHDAMLEWPAIWIGSRGWCSPRPCRRYRATPA